LTRGNISERTDIGLDWTSESTVVCFNFQDFV